MQSLGSQVKVKTLNIEAQTVINLAEQTHLLPYSSLMGTQYTNIHTNVKADPSLNLKKKKKFYSPFTSTEWANTHQSFSISLEASWLSKHTQNE